MYQEQIKQTQDRIQNLADNLHELEQKTADRLSAILGPLLPEGFTQTTIVDGRSESFIYVTIDIKGKDEEQTALNLDYCCKANQIRYRNVSSCSYTSNDKPRVAKIILASKLLPHEKEISTLLGNLSCSLAPIQDAHSLAHVELCHLREKQRKYEEKQIADGFADGDWYASEGKFLFDEALYITKVTPKKARVTLYRAYHDGKKENEWRMVGHRFYDKETLAFYISRNKCVKKALPAELA